MNKTLLPALALLAFAAAPVAAQPAPDAVQDAPPPPSAPDQPGAEGFLQAPEVTPSPVAGESVEPDITIRESEKETVYEYRVRGRLYMVRIQPQFGPPYYLVDTDGNGTLDMRRGSPTDISIPQWVLFSWD